MKLHELFDSVPVHSYVALEVRNDDGNDVTKLSAEWCDGCLPQEFSAYEGCEVWDVAGHPSRNNLLRIVVMTSERIVKRTGAWYYYDAHGTEYEIAELNVPNGTATYDIGALIRMHPDVGDGMTVYDWFAGVGSMSDMELIESCRYALKSYREKNL